MNQPRFTMMALAALVCMPHAVAASGYTALDITPAGAIGCSTRAINRHGQVVGQAILPGGAQRLGFVTGPAGSQPRLIGVLGGQRSLLNDINDDGDAVGESTVDSGVAVHAILVRAGTDQPIDLGTLGGADSDARAINTHGRVAGRAALADGSAHGFVTGRRLNLRDLAVNGTVQAINAEGALAGGIDLPGATVGFVTAAGGLDLVTLDSLGGNNTVAIAMNRRGVAVGLSTDAGGKAHAFITDPGGSGLRDLGLPGIYAVAQKINNHGKVVGAYTLDWAQGQRAFVARDGRGYVDLSSVTPLPPGVSLTYATGINDAGHIAAFGTDKRCYLLTPAP